MTDTGPIRKGRGHVKFVPFYNKNNNRNPWVDSKQDLKGFKVEVSNLHFDVSNDDLHDLFGSVGQVTHLSIKYDQLSGRSQGFASVYFLHEHDADAAIAKYNGLSLDGINMELKRGKTRFGMLDRVGDKMRIEKPASKSIADRLGEPVASSSNSSDILARLGSKTTGILSRLDGTPKPQREKKIIQKHPENKDSRSLLSYGEVADEQVMGDL